MAFEWARPGRTMSTVCSTPTSYRTNQAQIIPDENLYSLAIFTIATDLSQLLSIPCLQSKMDKSQRHCFLFYIYGWFFGLGTGLVAAILSFVENGTMISRVCLSSAVMLSVVVAVLQISLNSCCKKWFNKDCRHKTGSAFRIGGLFIIMAATLAGTFTSDDPGGLFFICGVFSFACYLMACIGFSVRLYRESKKNSQMQSNMDHQEQVTNGQVYVCPEWVPQVSVIFHRDDDQVQIPPRRGSQAYDPEMFNPNGEPLPILKLPTYLEAIHNSIDSSETRPPEYSLHDTAVPDSPSNTIPPTPVHSEADNVDFCGDLPPQYQDLVRESSWTL